MAEELRERVLRDPRAQAACAGAAADENAPRAYALAAVGRNLCDGPTSTPGGFILRKPDD